MHANPPFPLPPSRFCLATRDPLAPGPPTATRTPTPSKQILLCSPVLAQLKGIIASPCFACRQNRAGACNGCSQFPSRSAPKIQLPSAQIAHSQKEICWRLITAEPDALTSGGPSVALTSFGLAQTALAIRQRWTANLNSISRITKSETMIFIHV